MLKVLQGHDSPETAYVVNDYPYGFRLRCKIRYWLEFKASKGFRLVSQTTNPKIESREVWNKPKASTYSNLGVMGLDENGHVQLEGLHYPERAELEAFNAQYAEFYDRPQRNVASAMMAAIVNYEAGKKAREARLVAEAAVARPVETL